jgi:hypothetical protein
MQAHMGLAGVFTLNSEISQLSIGFTFSPKHRGHITSIHSFLSQLGIESLYTRLQSLLHQESP